MGTQTRSLWRLMAVLAVALALGCSGDKDKKEGPPPPENKGNAEERKNETEAKKGGTPDRDPVTPQPPPPEPVVSLTSKQYSEEYKKDKGAAKKYQNRLLEVTGVITKVGLGGGTSYLMLDGAPGEEVRCVTRDQDPWKKALPGQTVKVRGKGPESELTFPVLSQCEILEVSGPPPATLTADQLVAEYAKGEEAEKKYKNKFLLLTGEIAAIEFNEAMASSVTLKTKKAEPRVLVTFTAFVDKEVEAKLKSTLKPGAKVKVLGEYSFNSPGGSEVRLNQGVFLDVGQ